MKKEMNEKHTDIIINDRLYKPLGDYIFFVDYDLILYIFYGNLQSFTYAAN